MTYEGDFDQNLRHGYGVSNENGDIYEGNWIDDYKCG